MRSFLSILTNVVYSRYRTAGTAYNRVERGYIEMERFVKKFLWKWLCCDTATYFPKRRGFTSVTFSLWRGHPLASLRALNCSLKLDNMKEYCLDPHERKIKWPADKGWKVVHCNVPAFPDCQSKGWVPVPVVSIWANQERRPAWSQW